MIQNQRNSGCWFIHWPLGPCLQWWPWWVQLWRCSWEPPVVTCCPQALWFQRARPTVLVVWLLPFRGGWDDWSEAAFRKLYRSRSRLRKVRGIFSSSAGVICSSTQKQSRVSATPTHMYKTWCPGDKCTLVPWW